MSDINDMQAGPEMDALVAVEVMGWSRFYIPADDQSPVNDDNPLVAYWEPPVVVDLRPGAVNIAAVAEYDWSPSTNIAHAWEVVEKIKGLSYYGFTVWYCDDKWRAGKIQPHDIEGLTFPWDDSGSATAPLAICRAALLAVRHG